MQFSTTTALAFLSAAASTVSAQAGTTIKVTVGNGSLVYSPNDIQAAPGTAIEFSFFPKNHTVTQSSFKDPCHPLAGGFFSGFVPTASPIGETFTIIVNDTKPIWIYCGQTVGNHCQSGMVAAINAQATGNTLAAFKLLAANATLSTSPPTGPVGGVLKKGSGAGSTGGSGSGSSPSATTTITVSTLETVTASVLTTVSTLVTKGSSTYSTTYATSVGTTYTTSVAAGTGVGSGSSTASTPVSVPTGAANKMMVGAGAAGAAVFAAMAML